MTADQILKKLPNPDIMGSSEYRAAYDLLSDGLKSAEGGEDLLECAYGMLEQLKKSAVGIENVLEKLSLDPASVADQQ